MIYGMVLGGGAGRRLGGDIPKQFLEIGGRAVISYSARTFLNTERIDEVLVLVPQDWVAYTEELLRRDLGVQEHLQVLAGGAQRNDTIMKGIEWIRQTEDGGQAILITHDAARPFVTEEMINANIDALQHHTACDTVIPAVDTIVVSEDGQTADRIPDRSVLYQSQTPQSFRLRDFAALYTSMTEEEKRTLTDAIKVFVLHGDTVALVPGAGTNIKITYPADLALANALLSTMK